MLEALVLDDDAESRSALAALVGLAGFETVAAGSLGEARRRLGERLIDVALVDLTLPDGSGLDIIRELQERSSAEIVVVTGRASVDSAVEALRLGAADYLTKPVDVRRLRAILANIARMRELKGEISALRRELLELGRFGSIVGASQAMRQVYELVSRAAPTEVSVLLVGESGTGKEQVANALHELSKRHARPFVAVNCGAISPGLIESELFGHVRGAFTGAVKERHGYFELAAGGTLFLDEITEMPMEFQVKLLRVLETHLVRRVGGETPIPLDVRLIAATNQDPEQAIARGALRRDLFFRLNVFPIHLPPLREREDDVVLLAEHFLEQLNKGEPTRKRFTAAAMERLRAHAWPGNVRELKNVVQRAFIIAENEIDVACLPEIGAPQAVAAVSGLGVGLSLAEARRRLILATMENCGGDKKKAATVLGISLKTLYNQLGAYAAKSADPHTGDAITAGAKGTEARARQRSVRRRAVPHGLHDRVDDGEAGERLEEAGVEASGDRVPADRGIRDRSHRNRR
ncbi:MAG TPA: sigma-54 dependent transcriptional regulator [Candidatus Binatia bacterium]|nr:sigma-54 dependent transcriptional regulator [Candidatus Binatia bacterium]